MKEDVVRQHTVPTCYLANFGVDGNQGRRTKIYFYNIVNKRYGLVSVEKMPVEKCFYDVEELGEDKQIIEKIFQQVEGDFATLLRKILDSIIIDEKERTENKINISDSDRKHFSFQLAMQITRSRAFREDFWEFYSQLKTKIRDYAELPEYTSEDIKRIHITDILTFKSSNFYANLFDDRYFLFLINHTGIPFITSDNPVITIDNRIVKERPISCVAKEITFFFPLSPYVAIEVFHKDVLKNDLLFLDVYDKKTISSFNDNMMKNCTLFLFSNKDLNPNSK